MLATCCEAGETHLYWQGDHWAIPSYPTEGGFDVKFVRFDECPFCEQEIPKEPQPCSRRS